jgi:hypothetical protein
MTKYELDLYFLVKYHNMQSQTYIPTKVRAETENFWFFFKFKKDIWTKYGKQDQQGMAAFNERNQKNQIRNRFFMSHIHFYKSKSAETDFSQRLRGIILSKIIKPSLTSVCLLS